MTPMELQPGDPPWIVRAFNDLGLKEVPGRRHNPRVLAMFRVAGHPEVNDDETAWCSAAVNTWMIEAGYRGTMSLLARSWTTWGKPIDKRKPIPRGAVLIFPRGRSSWSGHVCLCLGDSDGILTVIGGNQRNSVSITRYGKGALLAARWPETVGNSRTVRAGLTSGFGFAGAEGVDNVEDLLASAQDTLQQALPYLQIAKWLLLAVGFVALGFMVYRFATKWLRPDPIPTFAEESDV